MTNQPVRWGILGPGSIAKTFAAALRHADGATLVAIASRDPARPGLAESFPGARILHGYQALLDGGDLHRDAPFGPRRMGDQGRRG